MIQPRRSVGPWPWLLFIALVVAWLLLTQSVSPANIVLAVLLSGFLLWSSTGLRPLRPRVRRPLLMISLFFVVLSDIVRSNIAVASIVLGLKRPARAGLVAIPLELRDPHGLAVLAAIVTSTPGTVWVDLDADTNTLTLHVLDLVDEAHWIDWIKNRYERTIRRIFE